jgi:hypothetical protein
MTSDLRLLMIAAMYENGGNTVHRFFDGHPEMLVYPFESQLGTQLVNDHLASLFPVKYRWPVFALDASADEDYQAIIDEECKVRARTPEVSKFRNRAFDFSDEDRRRRYGEYVEASGRARAHNVAAFLQATFDVWKNHRRPPRPRLYVGYSPILVVDAERVLADFPFGHLLHVVRNPWSAYADTKLRPVPLPLARYMLAWCVNQQQAMISRALFPGRVHVVRLEDVLADPADVLGGICDTLGAERASSLGQPSWNGEELTEIYPWGTIRRATPEANRAAAERLSSAERGEIRDRAGPYLDIFDYGHFLPS